MNYPGPGLVMFPRKYGVFQCNQCGVFKERHAKNQRTCGKESCQRAEAREQNKKKAERIAQDRKNV